MRKDTFSARARQTNEPDVRVAVVAPRSVGSAVARNRARRRVREAFRIATTSGRPTSGLDIVVSARRVWFHLSSTWPEQELWARVLAAVQRFVRLVRTG